MIRKPTTETGKKASLEKRKKLRADLIARLDAKEAISISEAITIQRKILGITQEELAARADVALGVVKNLENEKGNPTLKATQKILDALGGLTLYVGRRTKV